MTELSLEVQEFLQNDEVAKSWNHTFLQNGKIHCKLTNRDVPCRKSDIIQHLNSKKYKLKQEEVEDTDLANYRDFIEESRNSGQKLWCKLCKIEINRRKKELDMHVKGRRCLYKQKTHNEMKSNREEMENLNESVFAEEDSNPASEESGMQDFIPEGNHNEVDDGFYVRGKAEFKEFMEEDEVNQDNQQKSEGNSQSSDSKGIKTRKTDKKNKSVNSKKRERE